MKIIIFLILILFIFKIECIDNIKNKNNNENHLYLLGKSGSIVEDYRYSNKDFNDHKEISSDLIFIGQNQTTEFSTNHSHSFFYLDVVSNKEYYIFVGNLEIGPLFEPESFQINSDNQFKFKLMIPSGGFIKVYIGKLESFNRDESLKFTDSSKNTGFITLDGSFKMSRKDQKLFNEADFNSRPLSPKVETPTPTPSQQQQQVITDTPLSVQVETPTPSQQVITDTPLSLQVETPTPSSTETKLPELLPAYSSDKPKSEITESSSSSSQSLESSSSQWTSYSSYSYNTIIIDDDESEDAIIQQIIQEQIQQQQQQQEQDEEEQTQQNTITTTVTTTQESSSYNKVSSEGGFGKIKEDNSEGLIEQVFYKNDNNNANDLYQINKSSKLNNNSIVFLLLSIIFIIIF